MTDERQAPLSHEHALSLEIEGELHGEKVSPSNFDVTHTLAYVSAFLDLLTALADHNKETLTLKGMRLESGSMAFKITTEQPAVARQLARDATSMVEGRILSPRGVRARVAQVVRCVSRLPAGSTPSIAVAGFRKGLSVRSELHSPHQPEQVELRVTVYRVGGNPAKLSALSEVDGRFTASLSESLARRVAQHLYREVDLTVTLERGYDGSIRNAEVHDVHPLEDVEGGGEAQRWRDWFTVAGADWDEVDDIEAELGRVRGSGV